MGRVQDKVAIVTGGSAGLGKATSMLLAREGAKVNIVDIQDKQGEETAKEINAGGGEAYYYHMNVSDETEVSRVCGAIGKKFGRIDILVNNAGISGPLKPTHEVTVEEWEQVLGVDAKGVFLCTKHVVPFMVEHGGSIVNISSVYGIVGGIDDPPPFCYHAAKGAVRLMTKSDAMCYAKQGIRVNSIHPGWIWTPMLDEVGKKSPQGQEEFNREFLKNIPLAHFGEPQDVAYGVLYLASDESKFTTGSELVIDGGYITR